ncbi:DUF1778 domain-containing protein [Frankia sp. RB7]|nr:DUF1778 domain-containing protein [Frankia sp. RB7]
MTNERERTTIIVSTTPAIKKLIREAASYQGQSITAFVVAAVLENARRVLKIEPPKAAPNATGR